MEIENIVKKLEQEYQGRKSKDLIDSYEEILSENVEELSKTKIFFNLPLNKIFLIISKVDFSEIEETDKSIEIIQNIIKNIIQSHQHEKETILIFHKKRRNNH